MAYLNVFKRIAKVAKIGVAARKLKRSDTDDDRLKARRALTALFADARGVTMKFGQLMAQGGDDPLTELTDSVEPLPLSDMIPVIEEELGRPATDIFANIEESSAAASLGQVHKAELKDGRIVAIKVQYPAIKDAVDAEMKLFGLMPGVGPVSKWGFDLDGYKTALRENMDRELDYRNEARRQEEFRQTLNVTGLIIPQVFSEFTTARVLVQEWKEGVKLEDVADWEPNDRNNAGRILLSTLLQSLFLIGEVHGDPHAGNFMFQKSDAGDVSVVLIDFGCTIEVAKPKRLALLKTILSLREDTPLSPMEAFAAIGFDADKLCAISGSLAPLAHILFEPFKKDGNFFVQQWNLKSQFEQLLGENRWWFRAAGEPTQILLLRAFQGFVQQQETIRCGLDWGRTLAATLPNSLFEEARALELPKMSADITSRASYVSTSLLIAKSLCVTVRENGTQIVALTMPAKAALNLESLIPPDVIEFLRASPEWDLEKIFSDVRARGLEPQEILNFNRETKNYHIWLE